MDSEAHIVESMQLAMREQVLEVLPATTVRNIIGLGLPEAVHTLYPDEPAERRRALCEAYSRHFVAGNPATLELFPNAESVLGDLKARGYQLAVATGKTRKGLDRLLSYNDWHEYFHATRCADETSSKPNPQMLNELLLELSCPPEQALMVGDTGFDLEMAKKAGIDSIGVSYGVHDIDHLQQYQPRLIIDNLIELRDWLIQ